MVFDIRNHFESLTQQLLARDLITPSLFSHGTFLGDQSEVILRDFLRVRLPPTFGVETGQLVFPSGDLSPQSDVIVFESGLNSIVGVSESGAHLIHAESAKVIIEVKRTVDGPQLANIQDYAKKLHQKSVSAKRATQWCQWAFAFRSTTRTASGIKKELGNGFHKDESVGILVILDVMRDQSELKARFTKQFGTPGKPSKLRAQDVRDFVADIRRPNSHLFLRDPANKCYSILQPTDPPADPPLLKVLSHLYTVLGLPEKGLLHPDKFAR